MTRLDRTRHFAKSTITTLLFSSIILLAGTRDTAAQCPPQHVVLNSQTDVNSALTSFPGCTEFEYHLRIEGTSTEDPITDLQPLSGLVSVDRLYLRTFETPEGPLSLEPLSGITSLGELHVDNSEAEPSNFPDFTPLTHLEGSVCTIEFQNVGTDLADLSFPGISRLGSLEIEHCPETTGLPAFENVAYMGRLHLRNLPEVTFIELPPSIITFGYQPEHCGVSSVSSGLQIWGCPNLTSVTCEASAERIGEMSFGENPILSELDISPVDSLREMLWIASPRHEMFDAFKELQYARTAFFIYESHPDVSPVDTLKIRVGQNSPGWTMGDPFSSSSLLRLTTHVASDVEFTGNFTPSIYANVDLNGDALPSVTGFSEVDSLIGYLDIDAPASGNLPDFTNLAYVQDHVEIAPNPGLTHIDEFSVLRHVGSNLRLEDHPLLADISGLAALDTVGGNLSIRFLPALENPGMAFSNLQFAGGITVHSTALAEFPEFPNLREISGALGSNGLTRLYIIGNPDLTAVITMPLLETYKRLRVTDNPQLTSFSISADADYSGPLTLTVNPLFTDCGSPGLCNAAAQTNDISLGGNGVGCNTAEALNAACGLLSTTASTAEGVEIYAEGDRLHVRSSRSTRGEIRLFDLSGRLLSAHRLPASDRHILPFPSGATGIILVRYNADTVVYTEKIFR